ncbi:MAG: polysaccharide lyase 6 family protein [Prevotellaceae bacterium]|jgi:poly(beta-D-mannuronate) lyase|nr:polysaccharide lyase 6 family protein [Prevotellaceae bacterium]
MLALISITSAAAVAAAYSYTPEQYSTISSKLNNGLSAGDTVYLENGVYNKFIITFRGNGQVDKPIVLIARNPGQVIISDSMKLWMSGSYLEVNGLVFKNGYAANSDIIRFHTGSSNLANNCRLTSCVIDGCNNTNLAKDQTGVSERWIMMYGKNNRVDHCYFANKDRNGVLLMVDLSNENSRSNGHIIENNFFGYREKFSPGNGAETIRLGDSERSQYSSGTIVRRNFFYECDGEVEVISIKSCDNLIQQNTFYESAGSIVCRHGHRNTIDGNVFIGNNKANCGGVRIINEGHKVYNNLFQDLAGTGGRSALCIMTGYTVAPAPPLAGYHQVKDADIAFNTFVNCSSLEFGTKSSYSGSTGALPPLNTRFWNNIIYNTSINSAIVETSGVDLSGISYDGNIVKMSSSSSWNKKGFKTQNIAYVKSNEIYKLSSTASADCLPAIGGIGNFDYITTDVTAATRWGVKDAGGIQYDNRNHSVKAPGTNECGVTWYSYNKPNY